MLHPNFVFLGALILLLGSIQYFIETLQGKVKPNRVTWFLWSLAPLIAFSAQIQQGVGIQSLLTLMYGLFPAIIFIASFVNKEAYWQITRFDIFCGSLSVVGLILWQITQVGNIAIIFSIAADGLAALPTFVKSYRAPETENYMPYLASSISAAITLLTIKSWSFAEYSFPLYIFVAMLAIATLIKSRIGPRLNLKYD